MVSPPSMGTSSKPLRCRKGGTDTVIRQFDLRPFHEAASHRTRRVRYTWQVFGLTGVRRRWTWLLLAVASRTRRSSAR